MKDKWKKMLAFVMAFLMVVGLFPGNMAGSTVYAATNFDLNGEAVTSGDWGGGPGEYLVVAPIQRIIPLAMMGKEM